MYISVQYAPKNTDKKLRLSFLATVVKMQQMSTVTATMHNKMITCVKRKLKGDMEAASLRPMIGCSPHDNLTIICADESLLTV